MQERKRVLDAALQPSHDGVYGWVVGRAVDVDISIVNIMVSKHHARISAVLDNERTIEADSPQYRWEVTDTLSSNRTFLDGYACVPDTPYEITEGATIQFGTDQAMIRCSFDMDDTDRVMRDAVEDGVIPADEDHGRSRPSRNGATWPDVAMAILNGPPGINKRLWWVLIAVAIVGYFWLIR